MKLKPGRPVKSDIRQNIIELLYFMGEGYAYDIHRVYTQLFPRVTARSIYYHLKKGVVLNEFVVKDIRKEKGEYSWGGEAEKIYYALGPNASPNVNHKVKEYFDSRK
ncbi:hypothetical protein KY363_03320 [Candidatus Woesearchaeota archaeon]|nr:hypothetical protein [Candidatus Woesearchaeota archaeon]